MGININVYDEITGSRVHEDIWCSLREVGDRYIPECFSGEELSPPPGHVFYEDEIKFRPKDFGVVRARITENESIPDKTRALYLCDLLEKNPNYWMTYL